MWLFQIVVLYWIQNLQHFNTKYWTRAFLLQQFDIQKQNINVKQSYFYALHIHKTSKLLLSNIIRLHTLIKSNIAVCEFHSRVQLHSSYRTDSHLTAKLSNVVKPKYNSWHLIVTLKPLGLHEWAVKRKINMYVDNFTNGLFTPAILALWLQISLFQSTTLSFYSYISIGAIDIN